MTETNEDQLLAATSDIDPLAKRIREAMEGANISQVALAKMVGVEKSSVNLWLNNNPERRPSRENFILISQVLGVSPEWLESGGPMEQDIPHETRNYAVNKKKYSIYEAVKKVAIADKTALEKSNPEQAKLIDRSLKGKTKTYASSKLVAQRFLVVGTPLFALRIRTTLWILALIKQADAENLVDRKITLMMRYLQPRRYKQLGIDTKDINKAKKLLEEITVEAEQMGIEIFQYDKPQQFADYIGEIEKNT